ncbi:MAG: putative DNA binding domain-containing protein [Methanosarcinales archaeon]|nr:putative DNA binding domain-containing protein [Methanosarcinales archaeon]
MNIKEIIKQPEGRRLELKEQLPSGSNLAKTVIAFSNDAGGEIYLGVKDEPREYVGLDPDTIIQMEEQISSMIFDQCAPVILPEFTIITVDKKAILRINIFKGNNPPYFLKSKGKESGTYIRVGSSNRLASEEIIAELERKSVNKSFDSEIIFEKTLNEIDIESFKLFFEERTGEELNFKILSKLRLYEEINGDKYPTSALILFSDDSLRYKLFPYAKIECARFKGTTPGNFIDRKTIDINTAEQAEIAFQFIMRHISQGTEGYDGVYRIDRWEYPIDAIREVVRNAIVHRDYALSGKDIKIAVFDDKIEVTSPGKLMPSVDFDLMEAGQSEIRNKLIAATFKKLGIIEQWGNGLKIIFDDLKNYPEIVLNWSEPGIAFRVTFSKKRYTPEMSEKTREKTRKKTREKILSNLNETPYITMNELAKIVGISKKGVEWQMAKLKKEGRIKRIGPDKGGYWEVVECTEEK